MLEKSGKAGGHMRKSISIILFATACLIELSFNHENLYADREFAIFAGIVTSPDEFIGSNTEPIIGVRYGSYFASIVGWESNLGYIPAGEGVHIVNLGGNLVVNLLPADVVPFVTAGLGTFIFWDDDADTKFAINYGGGLKFRMGGTVGLRLEYRQNRVKLDLSGGGSEFKGFNELVLGLIISY